MSNGFLEVFGDDDESLGIFLRGMKKLDEKFCNLMASGNDFTVRFEINGNNGKVNHVRVYEDDIERHPAVGKGGKRN